MAVPVSRWREEVLKIPEVPAATTERAWCGPWCVRAATTIPLAMIMAAASPRIRKSTALPLLRPAPAGPGTSWARARRRLNTDLYPPIPRLPHDLRQPIVVTQCNQKMLASSGATRVPVDIAGISGKFLLSPAPGLASRTGRLVRFGQRRGGGRGHPAALMARRGSEGDCCEAHPAGRGVGPGRGPGTQ
jgi:hypothetical protein